MTSSTRCADLEPERVTELGDLQHPDYVKNILSLWKQELPNVDASGVPLFVIANAVMLRFKAWQAEMLSRHNINLSDFQILSTLYLSVHGILTPSELRTTLWLTPGGVTRSINRLYQVGLVEYQKNTLDRRVTHIRLTARGKRRAREICEKVADFYRHASAELSPAQQKKIIDGMLLFLKKVDI